MEGWLIEPAAVYSTYQTSQNVCCCIGFLYEVHPNCLSKTESKATAQQTAIYDDYGDKQRLEITCPASQAQISRYCFWGNSAHFYC